MSTDDLEPIAHPCEGCGAEPGEECREWCLSWETRRAELEELDDYDGWR